MKKIFLLAVFSVTLGLSLAIRVYAEPLDWKRLHGEADAKSIQQAQEEAAYVPSASALYVLGLVYLNAHRDNDAGKAFERMRALLPESFEAQWGLAEVWRRQHDLDNAEPVLEGLVEKNPDFAPAFISLAYIRYTRMDFKECVRLAYRVVGMGKEKVDTSNYTRAYLLVAGGKGMLAHYGGPVAKIANGTAVLPYLKKAQNLQPDSPAVLFGLGSFYFLAPGVDGGDKKKAQSYLEMAVEKDPRFADAYVRLAQLYKINGDQARYEESIKKVKEIDPQNALFLDMENKECKFICISLER
ncbi:MAG: tetratricopeptide repeat protein [Candidatus Omnitrophica bacterium]|nr:tetratricopeptide repeat protein [Candidatus Omnitrophota bacterium]